MKKWIAMILTLVFTLCAGAAYAETPGNRLGFEVLASISDGTQNQIVSPVSLAYALALAAQGANGETKQQLLDALGVEDASEVAALTESLEAAGLKLANAAFAGQAAEVEQAYAEAFREVFGAEWFDMDDDAMAQINAWVSEHTDGMIENMLTEPLDENVALVLANAVAMDAKWLLTFDPESTQQDTFHAPDGDVTVEMMHKTFTTGEGASADYGMCAGGTYLRMGYADSSLSMYVILPGEAGVTEVLEGLRANGLDGFESDESALDVRLSMPKVDILADNSLGDTLAALGVSDAFDVEKADFTGIAADNSLYLAQVLQKARLQIDEEGTKAAAATLDIVSARALQREVVDFALNKPFVAVIADDVTGAVCFAGVIAQPVNA